MEGSLIYYPGYVITQKSYLATLKVFIKSTISTPGAHFMTSDIKNFYLKTLIKRYECTGLDLNPITEEIILQYNLKDISEYIYV